MKKLPLLAIRNSIEALKSDESPLNKLKVHYWSQVPWVRISDQQCFNLLYIYKLIYGLR